MSQKLLEEYTLYDEERNVFYMKGKTIFKNGKVFYAQLPPGTYTVANKDYNDKERCKIIN